MKTLFVECVQKTKKSIDAHLRNCLAFQSYLRSKGDICDIAYNDTIDNCVSTDYDAIIVSYSSFYGNGRGMERVVKQNPNAKLFWLTNEYNLNPSSVITKNSKIRPIDVIANYNCQYKYFRNKYFLNLNLLTLRDVPIKQKKYLICYYGTSRIDRSDYFRKYINSSDFVLSTSPKNIKKFKYIGCKFTPCNKFQWDCPNGDTLGLFKYSLYIEDKYTHTHFNNLANRFYEAVSNNTVCLFDSTCVNTLKKSEISNFDWQDFIINSSDDFRGRNFEADLEKQNKWKPYLFEKKIKMLNDFYEIISK